MNTIHKHKHKIYLYNNKINVSMRLMMIVKQTNNSVVSKF